MTQQSRKKVLVVDDEADAVQFVRAVLEEAGYEVVSAPDGDAGLEAARTEAPDLIILDVQMPGKDGFTVFAEARKDSQLASIPVLMLTGIGERMGISFSAAEMGDYMGEEPEGYAAKPVDPALLQQMVRDVLGG
ncbi:MAG: response regulator [Planctomycetota bacterium]|jgi:CheY-like chemotaxis protein